MSEAPALATTVRRTFRDRRLLRPGDSHVLVACSGGPDSMAMMHVLAHLRSELGLTLTVASVDHGLRKEAGDEVAQVGRWCDALSLPFVPLSLNGLSGLGSSLQEEARRARYRVLHDAAAGCGADLIAVGHHQEDQAETVLFRLLRGGALAGLAAIEARRQDGVIRPLYDCSKAAIVAFLAKHRIPSLEDPSNRDPRFLRPRIRQELLPMLRRENPEVVPQLARLADEAAEVKALYEPKVREVLAGASAERLPVQRLRGLPSLVRCAALREWLSGATTCALGRRHVSAAERLVMDGHGEVALPSGWSARLEGRGDAAFLRLSRGASPQFRCGSKQNLCE